MGESKSKQLKADEMLMSCSGVQTAGGRVQVRWEADSAATPMGQLAYFIEFLTLTGLWSGWQQRCPLSYSSPNAPSKADVLGTWMLSVLSGHRRYSHVTTIRCDGVNPGLLGMNKVISEDALRRALLAIPESERVAWLDTHLPESTAPLLDVPWILDIDTTIKPLYGKQEGAVVSYNPHKPGRPSHSDHTYLMAGLRLVMGVEVKAGNEHSGSHSLPGLLKMLDELPANRRPKMVRGDCGFGSDGIMRELEAREQPYLFKLRLSKNVKRHIERLFRVSGWTDAGQGWEGMDSTLALTGWEAKRRVVVLRRPLQGEMLVAQEDHARPAIAGLHRGRPQGRQAHHRVRISRAGHQSRSRSALARSALPRPGRCGEYLRRAQEPVGLGRLHHARSASLPTVGACRGADLQLVESVRASGQPRSPTRGHHQPALVDVLGRSAHRACGPDHDHADRPACLFRQGSAAADAHLPAASSLAERGCGAV